MDGWIHDDEIAAGSRSMDDGVNDTHGFGYMGGWDMAHWSFIFDLLFWQTVSPIILN
jgi:hypothetical protein